jgi:hypothetical protein
MSYNALPYFTSLVVHVLLQALVLTCVCTACLLLLLCMVPCTRCAGLSKARACCKGFGGIGDLLHSVRVRSHSGEQINLAATHGAVLLVIVCTRGHLKLIVTASDCSEVQLKSALVVMLK